MSDEARWLDREAAARHVSVRVDQLPRLVRAGRLPQPSYHLGPRNPRWDRLALDSAFQGGLASTDPEQVAAAVVQGIYDRAAHADRAARPRGRHR